MRLPGAFIAFSTVLRYKSTRPALIILAGYSSHQLFC